jgi:hypothetical protein
MAFWREGETGGGIIIVSEEIALTYLMEILQG